MKCCAICFGDRGLASQIDYESSDTGKCDFCASSGQKIIAPRLLADRFEALTSIYENSTEGKYLHQWMKEDWALFTHTEMDDANAQRLLAEVLDDGQKVRQLFAPSDKYDLGKFDQWEELQHELKHENRFFPKSQIDFERLAMLLAKLVVKPEEISTTWFRSRIQLSESEFDPSEMSAPPPGDASHGRANPAGIPYLYLASDTETAISEVRPHSGETACVADCSVRPDLVVVDLRNPRQTISPFLLEDEVEVGQMRYDLPFLERFGEELSRPVRPQVAAYGYAPSQYLCEFVKKCGFAGIVYGSATSSGTNLALFNPDSGIIGERRYYTIDKVSLTYLSNP